MSIFHKDNIGANELKSQNIFSDPMLFLAFGFGSGLAQKAPGTMGTLVAVPIYLLCMYFGQLVLAILTVVAIIAGIFICDQAAKKLGEHDFGGIVWDEIAGFLVTMCWVPFSWSSVVMGFVLFRLFDIFKPWPISWADRSVAGGFGIMLDDVLAGILAGLLLRMSPVVIEQTVLRL